MRSGPPGLEGRAGARPREVAAPAGRRHHGPQPEQALGARGGGTGASGTSAGVHDRIRKTGWSGAMASSLSSGASGPTPWKNMPTSNFHFFR